MEAAIQTKGIRKFYGAKENRFEALRGINLEVFPGQLTLLVGPSGSGKTTLLSIITTILTPDEGELFLLGRNPFKMVENERAAFCRNNIGIVFQSLFLVPTLTVAENVSLPLLVGGKSQEESLKKAKQALARMHLDHRSEETPSILSKGQQQRVAIARAIITDSSIVVCDEPTSALDQTHGLEVMSTLHELANKSGKAVLVVTHDHRTFPFADRMININDGQIVPGEEK